MSHYHWHRGHFESILRDHTSKAWQKKLELKAKRLLAKDVREAINKALKKKKVEYLFPVWEQVLEKIRDFLDGKGDYRYLGNLNGLLKSLKVALNKINADFDEMTILKRFREWGKDTWRARILMTMTSKFQSLCHLMMMTMIFD